MTAVLLIFCGVRIAAAGAFFGPEAMAAFEGNLRSGYGFASVTSPSIDARVTPVARITLSQLYYAYPGYGGETHVFSPGLGFAVGARWRPPRFSLTALVGYEMRHTMDVSADRSVAARTDHGVSLTADGYFQIDSALACALTGYYGFAQQYVWVRALVKRQIVPLRGSSITRLAVGFDGTVHGNERVRGVDVGTLAELSLPGIETAISVRVGLGREVQPGAAETLLGSAGASIYKSF